MTQAIDHHFPPQPNADIVDPATNEWAPSNTPHAVGGLGEPSHDDDPHAAPLSNSEGHPNTYNEGGGTPDGRLNLLDAVKAHGTPAPPTQTVHHVMETREVAGRRISSRILAVVGNQVPTTLLEDNPQRERALIKVITSNSTILCSPKNQGGIPVGGFAAAPTVPTAFWAQATGEGPLEVKSSAAVDAYGIVAAPGVVLVAIWEESTT